MYLTEQTQWKESFPGVITCWFPNCKATNYIPSPGNSVIEEVVPACDSFLNWSLKLDGAVLEVEVVFVYQILVSVTCFWAVSLGPYAHMHVHTCRSPASLVWGSWQDMSLGSGTVSLFILQTSTLLKMKRLLLILEPLLMTDVREMVPAPRICVTLVLDEDCSQVLKVKSPSWTPILRPALSFHHLLLSFFFFFALRNLASQESDTVSFPVFSQTPLHWGTDMWPWFAHQTQSQGTWLGS